MLTIFFCLVSEVCHFIWTKANKNEPSFCYDESLEANITFCCLGNHPQSHQDTLCWDWWMMIQRSEVFIFFAWVAQPPKQMIRNYDLFFCCFIMLYKDPFS